MDRAAPTRDRIAGILLWISYPIALFLLSISYAAASHDGLMRTLSEEDARRIGAELKRWSQRPIRATNRRALGLCGILIVLLLVATQHAPNPAATIRGLATMFVVMQGSLHFMSLGLLRGLLRAGVGEAQDAIDAARDPRRISGFDMAMLWTMVAWRPAMSSKPTGQYSPVERPLWRANTFARAVVSKSYVAVSR